MEILLYPIIVFLATALGATSGQVVGPSSSQFLILLGLIM